MPPILLPANEYQRQRWRNGLGWTREILRMPDSVEFAWRASIAEIDHDCAYSPFPRCDRLQVLLEGAGATLRFADGREIDLQPPYGRATFAGDQVLHCRLQDGPVRMFNLIHDPARVEAELLHRPLVGPMVFFTAPGSEWLIHLLGGHARLKDVALPPLAAGDSLRLLPAAAGHPARSILDGGGELLAIRVRARDVNARPWHPPAGSP